MAFTMFKLQVCRVELTDHYNPATKTVNLSEGVYHGRNAAATAVAAHECGHAVQHAKAYSMLELRSALVPIQNVSGTILNFVMVAMMFGGAFIQSFLPTATPHHYCVLWRICVVRSHYPASGI